MLLCPCSVVVPHNGVATATCVCPRTKLQVAHSHYWYTLTTKRTLELFCSVGISHNRNCYLVVCTLKYIMSLFTYRFCFSHIDGEGWIGGKAHTCEQVTESDIQRIYFYWKEIGVLYFDLCLFACVMEGSNTLSTVKCLKIPSIPLCLHH